MTAPRFHWTHYTPQRQRCPMWVYKQTEPNLWTVGFYDPNGKWHTDSDHTTPDLAAQRCAFLNGANKASDNDR